MRVDVKKYLFIGLKEAKDAFFEQAQEKGIIHFINAHPSNAVDLPEEIQRLTLAIKILRGLPSVEQLEDSNFGSADGICKSIIDLKHKLNQLLEEERILHLEMARVAVFGDFSMEDIRYIEKEGNKKVQFFCAKKGAYESDGFPEEVVYIGSDRGLDYFITISDNLQHYDRMIEMKIEEPISQLRQKFERIKTEIHSLEKKLKTYAKYNEYLHHALIDRMNLYHLRSAQKFPQYEMGEFLFAVEGWVPENKILGLEEIVKGKEVYYDEVAIAENEKIPTCLQNEGLARLGEDIISIYDTPSNSDKDPSLWVLCFFSLFFAFIIGDGGYGLIFLAAALYFRFKFKKVKPGGKRFLNIFTILATSCVVWGLLTTSFFGISFGPDSPMQKFSLINWLVVKKVDYHRRMQDSTFKDWEEQFPQIAGMQSPEQILESAVNERRGKKEYEMFSAFSGSIMLELALLLGMIHVSLSFARSLRRSWAGIGWIIFIIGGYCYFPDYLGTASMLHTVLGVDEATVGLQGLYLLIFGFTLAVLLSVIQNKLLGLLAITTIIQVFADILSYLRLYALGLAGGIVSGIVNDLAGGLIFIAAVPLILVGHAVNITLSLMGGVIHGLRLNFLEWYHYCFEGDGKLFSPLQKYEVD